MMIERVGLGGVVAATMLAASLSAAWAHHGWRWTEDGNFELFGIIVAAELGNPHGVLHVEAEAEVWVVEVGSPGRNARAGLEDALLAEGVELVISGQRSADPAELRMKAERVYIDGIEYNLYPNRD